MTQGKRMIDRASADGTSDAAAPYRRSRSAPVVLHQRVCVDDIRVEAFIGVHSHEKNRRQSLIVAAQLDILPPEADTIDDTIDYNRIVEECRRLADRSIGLIENFARQLGEALLADPRVMRAEISVAKPGALPNGVARSTIALARGA